MAKKKEANKRCSTCTFSYPPGVRKKGKCPECKLLSKRLAEIRKMSHPSSDVVRRVAIHRGRTAGMRDSGIRR